MALNVLYGLKSFALILLSSFLLVLSFPEHDLGFLAWVGLVPLMVQVNGRGLSRSFFSGLVCGVLFFLGIFHWILEVPGYRLSHHVILGMYLGSYFGLFGLAFSFISRRWGSTPAFLAAPFLWVCLEFIRSNLFFLALPWGLLAHSQYRYLPVIQVASFGGAYGISFLIVMVNAAIAMVILETGCRLGWHRPPTSRMPFRKGMIPLSLPSTTLAALALLYGQVTLSRPITGKEIKVSVVQGNIDQVEKWNPEYADHIIKTYLDLTRQASKDEPLLVIWPETATPRGINQDFKLYADVRGVVRTAGTHLLLGSSQRRKFGDKESREYKYQNSAYLISPTPAIGKNQRYDKIRLLPFGEYLPLKGNVPWSYLKVPDIGGYVPGSELTIFELPSCRFAATICWENIFPDFVRRFVNNGAQFIVNITNEAWFGRTAAPYQFLAMSVFRAIENRVFVVRCANTGISCFIDPHGRIVDRVKDTRGQDIFVQGILHGFVIPLQEESFYSRYGDLLAWLCLICSGAFLFVSAFKKKKDTELLA